MKNKKLLTVVVTAGTLALISCSDSTSNPSNAIPSDLFAYSSGYFSSSSAGNFFGNQGSSADQSITNPSSPSETLTGASSSSTGAIDQNLGAVSSGTTGNVQDPTITSSASVPASSSIDDLCLASSLPNACKDEPSNPASSVSNGQNPAISSSSSAPQAESSAVQEQPKAGIFLAESKEEEKDIMQVEYKTGTGWDGAGILSYPKQLSTTQKHGIVVWGPGGGTEPGAYEGMIRRLASHGFVVIALKESPGDATQAMKAIDWMAKQNEDSNSPLYQKLDMNVIGCSGHSMGGLESEQAVIKDKRVLTAFLNNSGDWNGQGANKVPTDRTIAILYGEVGMEKDNARNDYNNAGVKAPACLIEMNGGPMNSEGGYGHGSGSWDGMAATVAWMRWHLGGETERKADFVGTSGKYIDGSIIGKQGHWKTQCKNF